MVKFIALVQRGLDGIKKYNNILVNALVNLGDVVLTTSAIALLRDAYPDAKITMLCKSVVRQAVENNPVIDDVITFDYKAKNNSIAKMWGMVKELRRRKFDLSISFDRKLRPALLVFFAGIPTRVGPDMVFDPKTSNVNWFYTQTINIPHDIVNNLQAETYQAIVRGFAGVNGHKEPVMARLNEQDYQKASELLGILPQKEKKIALCVKGTFGLKTWPKEYFSKVVNELNEKYNASFFVVGAPNDKEYSDEVISEIGLPVANFCGKTSLTELTALFYRADLLITVDTGATHIAATTGISMVTMYGCTTPKRWHPYNLNCRVMSYDPECCPCQYGENDCPHNPKPICLWEVKPERVIQVCRELLDKRDSKEMQ